MQRPVHGPPHSHKSSPRAPQAPCLLHRHPRAVDHGIARARRSGVAGPEASQHNPPLTSSKPQRVRRRPARGRAGSPSPPASYASQKQSTNQYSAPQSPRGNFVRNTPDVAIGNQVDVTGIVLNHQDIFPKENMIRSRDRIGNILRHIHTEGLEWHRPQKLFDLVSHNANLPEDSPEIKIAPHDKTPPCPDRDRHSRLSLPPSQSS